VEYARLLFVAGREREVYRILDSGIDLWYYPGVVPLGYYEFTIHLARKLGESESANDIDRN